MNNDVGNRLAERSEDLVAKLAARLRSGGVSPERVAYAAALGYGPALELADPAELPGEFYEKARKGALLLGQREAVLWACDVAEDALRKFWPAGDPRPWEAVAAVRAWAEDPSEKRRQAVEAAWAASAASAASASAWAAAAARAASASASASWAAAAAFAASSAAASSAAAVPSLRDEAWSLYLGWLAERLCWGPA